MMLGEHFRNIFSIPELRRKLLMTFGLLVAYRVGSHIPLPGLNVANIHKFREGSGAAQGVLVFLSNISGGALDSLSIFSLGIMPYISASIIFSLLVKVIPKLEEIYKEGASGQQRINQWTRLATIPLCLIQSVFIRNSIAGAPTSRACARCTRLRGSSSSAPSTTCGATSTRAISSSRTTRPPPRRPR